MTTTPTTSRPLRSAPDVPASRPSRETQRRLPITVEIIAPLKTIDAARSDLSTDEDEVLYLIEDGQLLAFDLRTPGAKRAEVRIYPPSIEAVLAARSKPSTINPQPSTDLSDVIAKIISTDRPQILGTVLRRRLVISSALIHSLLEHELLRAVPGTGNTINQTPSIIRASVVELLKARRM